jgi:hypothetical protein
LVPAVLTQLPKLEEIMAERNLSVDQVTIFDAGFSGKRPKLNCRCRPALRNTNRSLLAGE